ncbi:IclR family transcriptional regulator [Aromatoleum diolicum]|uniref:Helix-turn-helix domain-containing protein n=1 Tax=Aromatoleum diolicum TaxID=75796 RepID=A0ABX1QCF7_9RHOO|nr:IclR family transcriptional regulator [Aromatoleum diolicum]NMG74696.1 helix-turn-helix domain-containing protein [Aromatoleum diolicum]
MAGSLLARAMGALELLVEHPRGLNLQDVADRLGMPKSGAHRLLAELAQLHYVVQDKDSARYLLTTRLMSLGFKQLGSSGIVEVVQPVLNRLAAVSGELVRLAVVDNGRLPFVAKAQGARSGLRFDPDMGGEAALFCSSSGMIWLASLPENEAVEHVARQGFTLLDQRGPKVPKTIAEVLACVADARERGYSRAIETWGPGMSSMAAAVREPHSARVTGVLSIAGPTVRLTEAAMDALAPELLAAADELSAVSPLSEYLRSINPTVAESAPGRQRAA